MLLMLKSSRCPVHILHVEISDYFEHGIYIMPSINNPAVYYLCAHGHVLNATQMHLVHVFEGLSYPMEGTKFMIFR